MDSPHKGPVMRKALSWHDVIIHVSAGRSLECDFEEPYVCGYEITEKNTRWERVRGAGLSSRLAPETDSDGSYLGM